MPELLWFAVGSVQNVLQVWSSSENPVTPPYWNLALDNNNNNNKKSVQLIEFNINI